MANLEIRDGDGLEKFIKATGAGTNGDPFVIERLDSNGAAILTATQAIQAAVEVLDNIVSGSEAQVDVVAALPAGANNIGDVDVATVAIPSSIFNGQETVDAAGTAQAIGTTQALLSGVTVKALAGNAGLVYVGNSGVSSANGFELAAGESTFVVTDDVANVFVDAVTNDDGVCWQGS